MVKWFLSIVISTCNFVSTAQVLTNKKIVPKEIKIKDNLQRTILDYSVTDDLGIIQMIAPKDWTEPIVELSYETRGVVLQGTLGLAFFNETLYFKIDEGFVIPKNTKVRIFNAGSTTLKILEILRPAYKADKVKTHQSFR